MRYVVSGSRPATRKLVLSPGTTGSGAVARHDRFGSGRLNSTCIEPPEEGGALYTATRGLDVGLITAPDPTTRVPAVYDALADSPSAAAKLSLTMTWMS